MDELLVGLRAIAESTRVRILCVLSHGEFNVSELTQILGQSQPRVSRHLKLMVEAGMVSPVTVAFGAEYRKNQYEDFLFMAEDDHFELDMVVDQNASAINSLAPLADEIAALGEEERAAFIDDLDELDGRRQLHEERGRVVDERRPQGSWITGCWAFCG